MKKFYVTLGQAFVILLYGLGIPIMEWNIRVRYYIFVSICLIYCMFLNYLSEVKKEKIRNEIKRV